MLPLVMLFYVTTNILGGWSATVGLGLGSGHLLVCYADRKHEL